MSDDRDRDLDALEYLVEQMSALSAVPMTEEGQAALRALWESPLDMKATVHGVQPIDKRPPTPSRH